MIIEKIKDYLRGTKPYDLLKYFFAQKELRNWEKSGKPIPPPHSLKVNTVKEYATKYGLKNFIETGTYRGEMVYAVKDIFAKIYSIELNAELYSRACRLFSKYNNILILQGDSGEVLPELLDTIKEPCLFWIDAHYSGPNTARAALDTPIMKEISHIIAHNIKQHVVLIDDGHLFVGENDYPKIQLLKEYVLSDNPGAKFELKNNIIRISF